MFPDEYRFIDGVFLVDLTAPVSALPGDTAQGTEEQRLAYEFGVGLGLAFYVNVDPREHVRSYP